MHHKSNQYRYLTFTDVLTIHLRLCIQIFVHPEYHSGQCPRTQRLSMSTVPVAGARLITDSQLASLANSPRKASKPECLKLLIVIPAQHQTTPNPLSPYYWLNGRTDGGNTDEHAAFRVSFSTSSASETVTLRHTGVSWYSICMNHFWFYMALICKVQHFRGW